MGAMSIVNKTLIFNLAHFNLSKLLSTCQRTRSFSSDRISIKDVFRSSPIGKHIRITGFVRAMRKQKENLFLDINDGSTFHRLQVVCNSADAPKDLSNGCSVVIAGALINSTHPGQPFELKPDMIQVEGPCPSQDYPIIARRQLSMDHVRQFLHLRPRTRVFGHILRIRSAATQAVHEVFKKMDFIHIYTPIITSNDCEGAGEVFTVQGNQEEQPTKSLENEKHFFDKKVYLTVSGQFQLEAMASALTNVYTIGSTFRAENSRTRHHISEFQMIEAEMAFMNSLDDLTQFIEIFYKSLTRRIMDECGDEIAQLHSYLKVEKSDTGNFVDCNFKRLTYTEAVDILKKKDLNIEVHWGQDLMKEQEKMLVDHCGGVPVFLTNFPAKLKPFYMKPSEENVEVVEAVDLLFPGVGELCGGSVREHRYEEMKKKIERTNLTNSLQWYLDLRLFGTCPHAGFGMGFERYLQSLLKIPNIKDTIPFPRWTHHCQM